MKAIVDFSYANGTVNYSLMKANAPEITDVIIKLNEGTGPTYLDTQLKNNIHGCVSNNYRWGLYHFATLQDKNDVNGDAKREADYCLGLIKSLPTYSIIPAIDVERNTGNLSKDQVVSWMNTFFSELKNNGVPSFRLYGGKGFLDANLPHDHPFGNIPLWVAHYTTQSKPLMPIGWTTWDLWQYSCTGRIPGVGTNVDLSRTPQ